MDKEILMIYKILEHDLEIMVKSLTERIDT